MTIYTRECIVAKHTCIYIPCDDVCVCEMLSHVSLAVVEGERMAAVCPGMKCVRETWREGERGRHGGRERVNQYR